MMNEVCAVVGTAPVRVVVAPTTARAFASSSRSRSVTVDPGYAGSLDDVLLGAILAHELGHLEGVTGRLGARSRVAARVLIAAGVLGVCGWWAVALAAEIRSDAAVPPGVLLGAVAAAVLVLAAGVGLLQACRRAEEFAADRYAVDVVGPVAVLAQRASSSSWVPTAQSRTASRRAGTGRGRVRWVGWLRDHPDDAARVRAIHAYAQGRPSS